MFTSKPPGPHRARQLLEALGRRMPDLWAQHSAARERAYGISAWPEWCYAPIGVVTPIIAAEVSAHEQPFMCTKLTALATWRMSQGIYRVDPTLLEALVNTPLDGAVPVDILLLMPEWAIYIELPQGVATLRGNAVGVWVWREPGRAPDSVLLCMLFDTECDIEDSFYDHMMFPFFLELSGDSLAASLDQTFPQGANVHHRFRTAAEPVIAILLYLCSQNADVTRNGIPAVPTRPAPVRTRRLGTRLFPAPGPTAWEVGVRLGSALRSAYAARDAVRDGSASAEEEAGKRIPHIRRQHWHTFLSGPRKGVAPAARRRSLRWMPPIAVNLTDFEGLLATIKPVH